MSSAKVCEIICIYETESLMIFANPFCYTVSGWLDAIINKCDSIKGK